MAGLRSESRTTPAGYETSTVGPSAGRGRAPRGRGGGGGGGGRYQDMFESLFSEAQAGQRSKRRMAEERFSWEKRAEKKKYRSKLGGGKLKKSVLDPMRYANKQRQAARNAQFSRGGYGRYGEGRLAMKFEGARAQEQALQAYPQYAAAALMG